jgi:GWxTD domain-containing protein
MAERLVRERPSDVGALILLGRVHLAWPAFGRFRAESLFSRAAALDPANPEPLYYLGRTGLALGGDDGEAIARGALVRLLALDPLYRDTWTLFSRLYRGERERRAALAALELHAGTDPVDLWRAQLMLELRLYQPAESLLAALADRRPADPAPWALVARALYEQQRDAEGEWWYQGALYRASADTAEILWLQVRSIASPSERVAQDSIEPAGREAFLRRFWAVRDPELSTRANERIGEHFRRMAEARRLFGLLHPNARYHRSRAYRTVAGGLGGPPGADLRPITRGIAGFRAPRVDDAPVAAGVAGNFEAHADEQSLNLEDGLDDRGRVFARHGAPHERLVWSTDAETWRYRVNGEVLQVTFARRTGGFGMSGDQVITPVVSGEASAARALLATDRPEVEASLEFAFWPAAFRHSTEGWSELLLFVDADRATAVLVDQTGRESSRDSAERRPLRLASPAGRGFLLVDAEMDRRRGRFRGIAELPSFADSPAVSSLLLASGADLPPSRLALELAAPGRLALPGDSALRLYAELYNLGEDYGFMRYEAAYRFERVSGGFLGLGRRRITTIRFERERVAGDALIESLVVDPARLPAGRYRVSLEILDLVRGARATGPSVVVELR